MENLNTKYNPKEIEDKWYAFWEEQQYFQATTSLRLKPIQ